MRTISMTGKERTRIKTIQMAIEKKLSQRTGTERLGVSERRVWDAALIYISRGFEEDYRCGYTHEELLTSTW